MTNYQPYQFILDAMTAVGTVGAVVVSLWVLIHRNKKFIIRELSVNQFDHTRVIKGNCLAITLENLIESQMEIRSVDIIFIKDKGKGRSRCGWDYEDEFVAPFSNYELLIPLCRDYPKGAFGGYEKAILTIKTTFGNKTEVVPKTKADAIRTLLERA